MLPDGVKQDAEEGHAILDHLEHRTSVEGKFVSIGELRDILRRAAALLCRTSLDQCAIVQHLVGIPFAVFTKQSIKLGISLWLGVINENPRMEPRIVAVIAERWEKTVRNRTGVFSNKLQYTIDIISLDVANRPAGTRTLFISRRNLHRPTRPS